MKQQKEVAKFVRAREWHKHHKPKELLLGMVEEIGEFRNIIKWEQNESKVKDKIKKNHDEVEDFFGDMLWELCSLANYCKVDMEKALNDVIKKHAIRYPLSKFKGRHENE